MTLRKEKLQLTQLTMELFSPADEEYIEALSKINAPIALIISPESCVESVRKAHGRNYTNQELFRTIEVCKRHDIPIGIFSMIALANDTHKTIRETWQMWEQICLTRQGSKGRALVHFAFGPMILLDPGSHGFDFPTSHGYRLIFKTLEDYINGMSLPSWHQWISYETKSLDRESITKLIIDSVEHTIELEEKYGLCSSFEADAARLWTVTANRLAIDVVNDAMSLHESERSERLKSFLESLDIKPRQISPWR